MPDLDTARDILANPARYCTLPTVYGTAWAILMEARGKTVNLDRLGPSRHWIDGPADADLRNRIRNHAIRQGYALPRSPRPLPPGAA